MNEDHKPYELQANKDGFVLINKQTGNAEYKVIGYPETKTGLVLNVESLNSGANHHLILSCVTNTSIAEVAPEWLV